MFDYVLPSLTGSASADAEGSAGAASWKLDGDTKLSAFVLDTLMVDPEVGIGCWASMIRTACRLLHQTALVDCMLDTIGTLDIEYFKYVRLSCNQATVSFSKHDA